jgi:hypothetical protein
MTETETAPRRSFAEFFAAEIAPGLPALEAQRRDRRRNAYTRLFGAAFAVVVAALIVAMAWHALAGGALLVVGAIVGLFWGRLPARRHHAAVREHVIPPLLRFLGSAEYHRQPGDRFDLERVRRSGIAGAFTRARLEDLFLGTYRDTEFRLVEARLYRKRGSGGRERRTVFAGLLCDVNVPAPFAGTVLLVGDRGTRGDWIAGVMQRNFPAALPVALDHPAFAERYRVYADDAAEAARLLQPGLRETLLALADELGDAREKARQGGGLNCAFLEGRFLMAIPQRRDLFEIGRLHRSLEHAEDDLRRLAAEFTVPQRLIDNLHGERKPVLPRG